jgi:D-glycero-D-manno-heptose 1,7-bisphosphate phosphatase
VSKKGKHPAVFLDRDGVIIVEKDFQIDPDAIKFIPGSLEGLKNLGKDILKVIISNQSGVARGYFTERDVLAFNDALRTKLMDMGIVISGWYFCPHGPGDKCECRKPKPGMFLRAAEELNIDLVQSWMVGDKSSDIAAGAAVGAKTILVGTGYGGKESGAMMIKPDYSADNLYDAVEIIKTATQG